jgi:hypothetical protein
LTYQLVFHADHLLLLAALIKLIFQRNGVIAALNFTTSCRTHGLELDVDDAVMPPITSPSCRSFTLQLLLASHQLSMMTMISRHRCRHRADSPRDDGITPSSWRNGIAPSLPAPSGIAPPLRRDGITPSSPRSSITPPSPLSGIAPQPAASGITPPTASASRRRPPPRMESADNTIVGFSSLAPPSMKVTKIFSL